MEAENSETLDTSEKLEGQKKASVKDPLDFFIGDLLDEADPNARLMRKATYASVFAVSMMIIIKSFAWFMTGSVSLLASLVDSFLDMVTSLVTLVAVRTALLPPDEDHSFGHGKAESIAGLIQSAFIGGSALFIIVEALERFMHPKPVVETEFGVLIMFLSAGITFALVLYQRHVVKHTNSIAIEANSVNYTGDIMVNGLVILALLSGQYYSMPVLDVIASLLIAVYLLYNCWDLATTSFGMLMDKEFPQEDRDKIKEIVAAYKDVLDMHDLKTRSSGMQSFVQINLAFDGGRTLSDVHSVGDKIADEIMQSFPNADVIVHHDPV